MRRGKARGRPRSANPRKQRAIRWSDAEWAEVQRAAEQDQESVSAWVRRAVLKIVRGANR